MPPCPRQALSSLPLSPQAVRPLKNFLQGQGGGIKDFIKRNTSTRPNLKVGCVQGGEENGRRMCWEGEFWCFFQTFNRVFLCPFSAGRLCCKYDTLSVGLDTLTALSPHANVRQPSGHIGGEVTGSLCRCVLLGLGTAGSFWPLSQAALCSLSTVLPAAGTGGHLQQGYALLF